MTTYYLGKEETRAYLRDLLERVENFEARPTVWCPITRSGEALVQELLGIAEEEFPHLIERLRIVAISVNAARTEASFPNDDPTEALRGQNVLLLDGAIHSGGMMSLCATEVLKHEPAEMGSYSLVMKQGSRFLPTLWGLMMEETDRAFFLLRTIPNHRLDTAGQNPKLGRKQPQVHLHRLNEGMLGEAAIKSGVDSMDRVTWSDRYFQMQASGNEICTYALQRGRTIVGFLTLHRLSCGSLMIDEVVAAGNRGYGGILMRFADTMARQGKCRAVRLLAIKGQVDFYEKHEYVKLPERSIRLDKEEYFPMEKVVLYHQSPIR